VRASDGKVVASLLYRGLTTRLDTFTGFIAYDGEGQEIGRSDTLEKVLQNELAPYVNASE